MLSPPESCRTDTLPIFDLTGIEAAACAHPEQAIVRWSGDYVTKLFEGSYENAPTWLQQFTKELEQRGHDVDEIYFFYATCPKCVEVYSKNDIVAVAKLAAGGRATSDSR